MTIRHAAVAEVDEAAELPILQHNVGETVVPVDEGVGAEETLALREDRPSLLGRGIPEAVGELGLVVVARGVVLLYQSEVFVQIIGGGTAISGYLVKPAQKPAVEPRQPHGVRKIGGVGAVLTQNAAGQKPIVLPAGGVGQHLRAQTFSKEETCLLGFKAQRPLCHGLSLEEVAPVAVNEVHPRRRRAGAVVDVRTRQKGTVLGGEGQRVNGQ